MDSNVASPSPPVSKDIRLVEESSTSSMKWKMPKKIMESFESIVANGGSLVEYRLIVPITVEEYHIGQRYGIAKTNDQQNNKSIGETNFKVNFKTVEPNSEFGDGVFTHKFFDFSANTPSFLKYLLPDEKANYDERSWNAYPMIRTKTTNDSFPSCCTDLCSYHASGPEIDENIFGLSGKVLQRRKVEVFDVVASVKSKDYLAEEDPQIFESTKRLGRGKWKEGEWMKEEGAAVTIVYKLFAIQTKIFGVQTVSQSFVTSRLGALFNKLNRSIVTSMDEWIDMSLDDILQYETKVKEASEAKWKAVQEEKRLKDQDKKKGKN